MTAAAIAVTSTAPAATSFARAAKGWISGEARSVSASIAVLKPSAVQTAALAATIQHHSIRERWNAAPATSTSTVAAR